MNEMYGALAGFEHLMHGIAVPILMGLLSGIVRLALHGWKGFGDWAATTFIGIFAGLIAHWLLAGSSYDSTMKALIEVMAALFGRDIMSFLFSKRTLAVLARASLKRAEHEILNRGRARNEERD